MNPLYRQYYRAPNVADELGNTPEQNNSGAKNPAQNEKALMQHAEKAYGDTKNRFAFDPHAQEAFSNALREKKVPVTEKEFHEEVLVRMEQPVNEAYDRLQNVLQGDTTIS